MKVILLLDRKTKCPVLRIILLELDVYFGSLWEKRERGGSGGVY
jgi:hypothetical protein